MAEDIMPERSLLRHQKADAQFQRGLQHLGRGDRQAAIRSFTRAIRLDRHYPYYYDSRGITYAEQGEYARAIADFDRAIELDPNDALAY